MAITVGKLFGNGAITYNMKLLAGMKGLNNLVEWVHIIENDEVSQFLHGHEVVLTSGILNDNKGWLLYYAKKLHKVGTSAFIVNIGPYTKSVDKEVIEFCNKVDMPLYTIPWETRMVDITRDICSRILRREQVEISVSATIKNIIFKIGDLETQIQQMERYGYLQDSKFCFIAMCLDNKEGDFEMNRVKVFSERIARNIHELYISFPYNECWILVLVNYSNYDIDNFVKTFYKSWNKESCRVYMGISQNNQGIRVQDENFNKAFKAMEMAKKQEKDVVFYDKLHIYKLLLEVKDKSLLNNYYKDVLGKLVEYDKENRTDLVGFLKVYLENNGSQQAVAEKQYIHRNTVNNQIKKIEKITGFNPLEIEEKMKFVLGFYIKDII
ncbi:PucR family transcriptional regulator [Clostridium butyricum]|uniref:PucR family transcriptional regulator n=1 Tax=Clostridium butyricum TaxID=1492 RepID=UPI0018A9C2B2|nr:PucR family transcriptional regulator ligand-binding domain-containing protein [Clostridium butyricum]